MLRRSLSRAQPMVSAQVLAFGLAQAYSPADYFRVHSSEQDSTKPSSQEANSSANDCSFVDSDNLKLKVSAGVIHRYCLLPRAQCLFYSITLSASIKRCAGIFNSSALAVLRLITSSNFVGRSIGRSAGLAPLRILSM